MSVIEVQDVKKTFKIGQIDTQALRGVSMSFERVNLLPWLGRPVPEKPPCCS